MTRERLATIAAECSQATGWDFDMYCGESVLESILEAERAGATIYWGCLPSRDVLAGLKFPEDLGSGLGDHSLIPATL